MKPPIFVDTSAWYAIADADDINHQVAKRFLPGAIGEYRRLLSTNHVVGETYTLLLRRLGYKAAWTFLSSFRRSPRVKSVFVTQEQEGQAYGLLERHSGHNFSFVDGTSFVVMMNEGISLCFGFDRHFEAIGFRLLPA